MEMYSVNWKMEIAKAAVRQYGLTFGTKQKAMDVALAMGEIIRDFPNTPMAKIAANHIERAKEMSLKDIEENTIFSPQSIYGEENINGDVNSLSMSEIIIGNIFIPIVDKGLKEGIPFVFSFDNRELVNCIAEPNSESAYKNLLKLGKGDIAWDDSLITLRKAKALTIKDETLRPLKYIPGKWCDHYELPDKVSLPYSFLIVTNEGNNYLLTIQKIETEGITVSYKRLSSVDFKLYIETEQKQKQ